MGITLHSKLQLNFSFSALTITDSTAGVNILEDKTSTRAPDPEQSLEGDWVTTTASTTPGEWTTRARVAAKTASATSTTTTAITATSGQCQAFRTSLKETRGLIADQRAVGVITFCSFYANYLFFSYFYIIKVKLSRSGLRPSFSLHDIRNPWRGNTNMINGFYQVAVVLLLDER